MLDVSRVKSRFLQNLFHHLLSIDVLVLDSYNLHLVVIFPLLHFIHLDFHFSHPSLQALIFTFTLLQPFFQQHKLLFQGLDCFTCLIHFVSMKVQAFLKLCILFICFVIRFLKQFGHSLLQCIHLLIKHVHYLCRRHLFIIFILIFGYLAGRLL
uniref:Uncharacterized protein n=1 Tax=Cacopsylla melanoneura TaxID=428564 RepID=A0A8D8Z7U7_9HEMI